jgi:hypothetical protein
MQNVEEPKINECVLEREIERERLCRGRVGRRYEIFIINFDVNYK